jgi:HAD superfamily hydrolase (TIGR01509 family)
MACFVKPGTRGYRVAASSWPNRERPSRAGGQKQAPTPRSAAIRPSSLAPPLDSLYNNCHNHLEAITMIQTIIFDLAEVLVSGMHGVERPLARRLGIAEEGLLRGLGGEVFLGLMRGRVTEDAYLAWAIDTYGWDIAPHELKQIVRDNFRHPVPGTAALVKELAGRYELALLTDHGREWMAHILTLHPFLELFDHVLTSYDLGRIKADPGTFEVVLDALGREAHECLFVDDNPVNVDAAGAAGIDAILFESAEQLRGELARRGVLDGREPQ